MEDITLEPFTGNAGGCVYKFCPHSIAYNSVTWFHGRLGEVSSSCVLTKKRKEVW